MYKILIAALLISTSANAAEWSGKWGARSSDGGCSNSAYSDGDMLDISSKQVVGFEWDADIKGVTKKNGVYVFDLYSPESDMNGAAKKSKWLVKVAKDGKTLQIYDDTSKTWSTYDRCAAK